MQKFETTDLGSVEASSEETLFQTAIVPLKLILHQINVKIRVECTMFDGKVVNALTDTKSSQSCNICRFREEFSLVVDMPKQGSGTTNMLQEEQMLNCLQA